MEGFPESNGVPQEKRASFQQSLLRSDLPMATEKTLREIARSSRMAEAMQEVMSKQDRSEVDELRMGEAHTELSDMRADAPIEESDPMTVEEPLPNDERVVSFDDPEDYGYTMPEYD